MRYAANKTKTIHYDFRFWRGEWMDINNVEHYSLSELMDVVGIDPIPDYVDYCLIHTERCDIKYRKFHSIINIYITWY